MIEIRFHGRGGQGVAFSCHLLASALLKEGKYAQSSFSMPAEREGAPLQAFLRVDNKRVLARGEIYEPDHIVVFDSTLIKTIQVTAGLKRCGWIIINSPLGPEEFKFLQGFQVACCDANFIAVKYGLGLPQSPRVNTAILGALAKVINLVNLDTLSEAISEAVSTCQKENVATAEEAYQAVRTQ